MSEKEILDASERWSSLLELPVKDLITRASEEIKVLNQENADLALVVTMSSSN